MPTVNRVSVVPRSWARCAVSTSRQGSVGKRPRSSGCVELRAPVHPAPPGHQLRRGPTRPRRHRRRARSPPRLPGRPRRRARSRRRPRPGHRTRRPRARRHESTGTPSTSAACDERLRRRLALQALLVGHASVHHGRRTGPRDRPPSSTAGAFAEEETTASGSAEVAQVVEQPDRPRVGLDAVTLEHRVEGVVLAVAETAHGHAGRWVLRGPLRELDAARGEEVADAVVARLAVDVGVVVGVGVRRPVALEVGCLVLEEAVEHLRPGPHVHLGRRRDHAVEVEQCRRVVVPADRIHTKRLRGPRR